MNVKYLKYFLTFMCGAFFIFLMKDIWAKFNSNITSTGIKFTYTEDEAKLLPVLTGKCYTKHGIQILPINNSKLAYTYQKLSLKVNIA